MTGQTKLLPTAAIDAARAQTYSRRSPVRLESEQRTWLEWRRACADDSDCLEAAYRLRIKQMKGRMDDASGVGHP
jgi:uncharacterized protein